MFCKCVCVLSLVFWLVLTKDSIAQKLRHPAKDFSRHTLVQPTVHHARTKREILSTREKNGEHHSEVIITLDVDGEEYVLDLRLNHDLIADNHIISYQEGGKTVVHRPNKEELELCQYSGTVRGKPDSRVAVSTCHGIRGAIFEAKQTKYIEPAEGSNIKSFHYIYDHADYIANTQCGNHGGIADTTRNSSLFKEHDSEELQQIRANRYKRYAPRSEVHEPYNANAKSRYVELVFVVDNAGYHNITGRSNRPIYEKIRKVHAQMKDIANIINSAYSQINIFVVLVGVEVWTERDKIHIDEDSTITLDNFVSYRRNVLVYNIPNDNAHLITHHSFHNSVVGKAYTKVMCTKQSSAGIAHYHTEVLATFAMTIAHEMGHNFGMEHDDSSDCKCPDKKCIMYPSTSSTVHHFSSCSLRSLAMSFEMGFDHCLRNKPARLFDSPTCGNGFVEAGEQCDCGLPGPRARSACRACCHSDTCLLRANATCGAGTCCDLQTCRPKAAGSECRSAQGECDLPEYCTGHSEYCPDDVHKMDTTPCGKNTAYCWHGSCRSHTDGCRLLWGVAAKSCRNKLYAMTNTKGTEYGNCGYNPTRYTEYDQCSRSDALCGSLQCRQLDVPLQFGKPIDNTIRYNSDIYNNTTSFCTVVQIDLGLNEKDFGMVPDGASCGEKKMCLNHKCLPIATVARQYRIACPTNCSGHGICNSKGDCHCDSGFAPPLCAEPSGSLVLWRFMVAMYVIFLGLLPLALLALLATYYCRQLAQRRLEKPYVVPSRSTPRTRSTRRSVALFARKQAASLRRLLSFSRDPAARADPTCDAGAEGNPKYETKDKIRDLQKNYLKGNDLNKPEITINIKTDQRTVDGYKNKNVNEIINKINNDLRTANKDVKVRPPVKQKPVLNSSKENRPKTVIVKQGLTSTTNELIANISYLNKLNNISSIHIYDNPNATVHKIKK